MSNLFDTFKEAIENATMKWVEYKQKEDAYKGKVNKGLDELDLLIKRLNACIKKLVDLQDDYSSYIQRITQIRINMQSMLDQQITQITNRSGEDCDEKIRALLTKFQGFVNTIKGWEGDTSRFEGLLKTLKEEIDKLCDKADEIIAKNDQNKTGLDEELKKVEEAMRQGRGSSKEDADDERKEDVRQEAPQQQAQPENLPAGWQKEHDPNTGNDYYFCEATGKSSWTVPTGSCGSQQVAQKVDQPQVSQSRQQGGEFGEEFDCSKIENNRTLGRELHNHIIKKWNNDPVFQIERQAKKIKMQKYLEKLSRQPRCKAIFDKLGNPPFVMANLLDSDDNGGSSRGLGRSTEWSSAGAQALRGGRRTRKKRGGWQTPQKLESISRYSPIRRVERKKKKKKKRNTKKNKKRRRRKQTKRRGKKRN
uniref:WW domain-containing protein n=1 Tax=viral metagenome TaxID=1070528 RepID=A0A6C0KC15_9ZZZZ